VLQSITHLLGIGALRLIQTEHAGNQLLQSGWNILMARHSQRRRSDVVNISSSRGRWPWWDTGYQLIDQDSERKNIVGRLGRFAPNDLWASGNERATTGQRADRCRNTKITQVRRPVMVQKHVRCLDIAMHNVLAMRVSQRIRDQAYGRQNIGQGLTIQRTKS